MVQSRKLSPSGSYWFSRSWQTFIPCSFCSYVSIGGTHLVQTLWYFNVISNTLKQIFILYSFLIIICWFPWMNFVVWHLCVAIWNVACLPCHCHHCWNAPPTTSLCSHPLLDLQERSASVVYQWVPFFFHMEEFSSIPLLHMHFCVRHHFIRQPLCSHRSHSNKMSWNISWKVQPQLLYHHHWPLTLWPSIIN